MRTAYPVLLFGVQDQPDRDPQIRNYELRIRIREVNELRWRIRDTN
jgi:hypothetical protein